jgi:hypothetical protein
MKVLVGVISPAAAWNIPPAFVDRLRRDFPEHGFLDAWDPQAVRRWLPEVDAAFTPLVDCDVFPSAIRLRWLQVPAVGVGHLLYPAMDRLSPSENLRRFEAGEPLLNVVDKRAGY